MTTTVDLPVIASGGAGEVDHFTAAAKAGADAVLAASVFHFGQLSIAEVKQGLAAAGLPVRDLARHAPVGLDPRPRAKASWPVAVIQRPTSGGPPQRGPWRGKGGHTPGSRVARCPPVARAVAAGEPASRPDGGLGHAN